MNDQFWWLSSSYEDYDLHEQIGAPKKAFCRGCGGIDSGWYPRWLEAQLSGVSKAVQIQCKAPVFHSEVWVQISDLCASAILGPATIRDGDLDRFTLDWVTVLFPPNEVVIVRGRRKHAVHRICGVCERQLYFPAHDPHLVRCQIPRDKAVFLDHTNRLIVASDVAEQLDWSRFPDLKYEILPVLEEPLDGLRLLGDPDWSKHQE